MKLLSLTIFSGALLVAGCTNSPAIITGCESMGAMVPVCKFHNPEDMELLPDGKTLIVSQMGESMEAATAGSLVFFDTVSGALRPAAETLVADGKPLQENWGAPACPGNPGRDIAPHGISLRQRNDQRWQLAVVNHGGRESIEMFELLMAGDGPRLEWRGCVVPEPGTYMNDVVVLKNGGFIASHMFDKRSAAVFGLNTGILKAMLGINTGYVFEWQADKPVRILEESYGAFINGVELSADENTVFANVYFGKEVRKLDRMTGKKLGAAPIGHADNLAWDSKGKLLAVAHTGSLSVHMACNKQPGATCALEYAVHRIDPETMHSTEVLRHAGMPMGAATVAREVAGNLYLGSFTGDRIVRTPYVPPGGP